MSADFDGGAAPASLDDLVVAEPAEPVAVQDQPEAEDAGPAPEPES
ncbi:hypothetical protein ACSHWB_33540 [Lentzea sp. HUAS TT2]